MNRKVLFSYLRRAPFGGHLTRDQVKGTEAILNAFAERYPDADIRWKTNVLAQVFHETGGKMIPVREAFAESDRQAIRWLDKAFAQGRLGSVSTPYWREGWFGRGPIQVTHKANYIKIGDALGINLVAKPSLLLDPDIGAASAVVGMVEGLFTGHKLDTYFNDKKNDPVGARRIVNGTDKAKLIAKYHDHFLEALKAAEAAPEKAPQDVSEQAAKPDDRAPIRDPKIWTIITTFLTGLVGAVTAVASPWALAAVIVMTAAGVGAVWLFWSGRATVKAPT